MRERETDTKIEKKKCKNYKNKHLGGKGYEMEWMGFFLFSNFIFISLLAISFSLLISSHLSLPFSLSLSCLPALLFSLAQLGTRFYQLSAARAGEGQGEEIGRRSQPQVQRRAGHSHGLLHEYGRGGPPEYG